MSHVYNVDIDILTSALVAEQINSRSSRRFLSCLQYSFCAHRCLSLINFFYILVVVTKLLKGCIRNPIHKSNFHSEHQ